MTKGKDRAESSMPKTHYGRGRRSDDPRVTVSAGIKTSERDELIAIADSYGLTLGAVVTYFVKHSLDLHRAKKFKIPIETKAVVKL